ncbi:hypothetical protein [Herpetosiphon geysericola]|uniref:Uncharacterized protein n=1 Tax=Herpetosiphon geysericola TaxID=70996 RepID=A0A0P6YIN3_9CHLR|nr:hypothetical protein [Herpetosiphon geysericola]KPL84939.1 hypothetical protein SE18_18875 [Herpetosiphon geysericola]
MGINDQAEDTINHPNSRRSFLRNTGLAALATAGAISAFDHAAASTKPAIDENQLAAGGEIPDSAQYARRAFRSLTLLAISAVSSDQTFAKKVYDFALADLDKNITGLSNASDAVNSLSYTPNPDDDYEPRPWWWPRPWWRLKDQVFTPIERIPAGGLIVLDLHRSLDAFNMAFQYGDQALQAENLRMARSEIRSHFVSLKRANSFAAWEPGDDLCPPWWPFPWPPKRQPDISTPQPLLELGNLVKGLINYGLGKSMSNTTLSLARSKAIIVQLQGSARKMTSYSGNLVGWVDGDDICPRWPFPWPGPWSLKQLLDQYNPKPQPDPWHAVASEVLRASTIFAIASSLRDRVIAQGLRDAAIGQIQTQVGKLA